MTFFTERTSVTIYWNWRKKENKNLLTVEQSEILFLIFLTEVTDSKEMYKMFINFINETNQLKKLLLGKRGWKDWWYESSPSFNLYFLSQKSITERVKLSR